MAAESPMCAPERRALRWRQSQPSCHSRTRPQCAISGHLARSTEALFAEGDAGPHPFDLRLLLGGERGLGQLDGEFFQIAREPEGHMIILTDRRAGVLADVQRFIGGDAEWNGSLDAAFGHLLAVDEQLCCPRFA